MTYWKKKTTHCLWLCWKNCNWLLCLHCKLILSNEWIHSIKNFLVNLVCLQQSIEQVGQYQHTNTKTPILCTNTMQKKRMLPNNMYALAKLKGNYFIINDESSNFVHTVTRNLTCDHLFTKLLVSTSYLFTNITNALPFFTLMPLSGISRNHNICCINNWMRSSETNSTRFIYCFSHLKNEVDESAKSLKLVCSSELSSKIIIQATCIHNNAFHGF